MRLPYFVGAAAVLLFAAPAGAQHTVDRVAAVVGEHVIFVSEVQQRAAPYVRLIQEKDALLRARAEATALHEACEALIDDVVTELEAERAHVSVTDAEVDAGIAAVAKENHITVPEVMHMAVDQGYDPRAYRQAVRIQLLAGKILQLHHVDLSTAKPEEALQKMHAALRARIYIEVRVGS